MSAVKAPSCAPSTSFWLELTGQQSLAGHEYVLSEVDDDGNPVVIPMDLCKKHSGRLGPILAGHVEQPRKRSLVMRLKGDETIDVPVMQQESIAPSALKAPQREYQDSLMVSVHPTLFCDAGELTHPRPMSGYAEVIGAPLRTGWIYVFFRDRLWRELSVCSSSDATPVLRDTAVEQARRASPEAANERKPIGPELDVIHLPARLNGTNVYGEVYLAFSETQWSWEYISALEQDSALIRNRCRSGRAIRAFLEGQPNLDGDWKRLDDMPAMRARDNAIEADVTFPGQWLHDVDGVKSQEAQDALTTQRDAIEADEPVVDADYFIETPSLYPRWRQRHLQNEPLPTIQSGIDVFGPLRDRHLFTLHLRDTLQAARHLTQQMNAALSLLLALVDNVKKRPFGVTAELFHNNFRRETLPDGSANPLYLDSGWFDNRIDDSEDGRLKRTLYDVERAALREFLAEGQAALVRLLNDERPQNLTATLRDLFALESGNAAAGYVQTGPLLQVLSLPAHRADPLALPQESDANGNDLAAATALKIATGEHPLGVMLLPFQNSPGESQVGDATLLNLKSLVEALEDRSQDMRVLEPNVLRSMADHQEQSRAPDGEAIAGFVGRGASAFSNVAGEISQWWLTQVQTELTLRGAAFTADIHRIKSAFEGFAEAAIPGRTTLQLEGAEEGRAYIVLEVLDEQGNTLTSGAAVSAALKVSDVDAFDGVVKHQPVKRFMHQVTTHPGGLPGALVVFDVWNFINITFYTEASIRQKIGFFSALADLSVSSAHLASIVPQRFSWLGPKISNWKQSAEWFTRLAARFNSQDQFAQAVVRNQLQAAGWLAGMFTTALMVSDSVSSFVNGRWGVGSAQLVKAGGTATMVSADIIAARLLTPVGRRAVERTAAQSVMTAVGRILPVVARWTGTVASGYVTAVGFAIYVVGEIAFYRMMDDAVSKWLRAGPFSDDPDEQNDELASEPEAYIALVKSMTPVSLQRIPEKGLVEWLQERNLTAWQNEVEAVLLFASPSLAITGRPADVELVLSYEQEHYRILGPNPAGGWQKATIARKSGTIHQGIQNDFDEQRQAISFMIGKSQLSSFTPQSDYEHVETRYRVKSLSLTFTIDVWQRDAEEYESQEVTHTMEDLDVEWRG